MSHESTSSRINGSYLHWRSASTAARIWICWRSTSDVDLKPSYTNHRVHHHTTFYSNCSPFTPNHHLHQSTCYINHRLHPTTAYTHHRFHHTTVYTHHCLHKTTAYTPTTVYTKPQLTPTIVCTKPLGIDVLLLTPVGIHMSRQTPPPRRPEVDPNHRINKLLLGCKCTCLVVAPPCTFQLSYLLCIPLLK